MDILTNLLLIFLIVLIAFEVKGYYNYTKSAQALSAVGIAMQQAFEGVSKDVINVNEQLTLIGIRTDRLDEATDTLNSNDALIEIYLNLFSDALNLKAEQLNRIGTLQFPESDK